MNRAGIYYARNEFGRAIDHCQQALTSEVEDERGVGTSLSGPGLAYATRGDMHTAISFYDQHLAIARVLGDARGEGQALGNLGNAYRSLGETDQAREFYETAPDLFCDIRDRPDELAALVNLGNLYKHLGEGRGFHCVSFS